MRKKLIRSLVPLLCVLTLLLTGSTVLAASLPPGNTSLFPEWILNILRQAGVNGVCTAQFINSRARLALYLVMGGIVLLSVINIIIAAFRYITSQGESEKIKKANRSILGVFMGIAALIISIMGMVIVYVFMGTRPTQPALFQTCISAVQSQGCQICLNNPDNPQCIRCEEAYDNACNANTPTEAMNAQLDKAGLSYCYRN